MSISDAVAPHIPYLRRFARALTGTQAGGDAYVVATLEAILADPGLPEREARSESRALPIVPAQLAQRAGERSRRFAGPGDETPQAGNLAAITVEPRIAFLLNALESFTPKEIGQTIDCSEREALELIERAGREISAQIRTAS